MKKKIFILIYSLASGGAERVTSILLKELKKEFHITLVLMNNTMFYEIPSDVEIIYLEQSSFNENNIFKLLKLPILALKYKKLCKDNKIDTSLSLLVRPNWINILSKIFGNKSKCIISERSLVSEEYKKNNFQSKIVKYLISNLYNKADKLIGISEGSTLDLIENYNVIKEKIKIIYNPIDLKFISKQTVVKKINNNLFTFITVGRLVKGKNHELLINSMLHFQDSIKLVIVGDGEEREKLELLVQKLKIKNIEFVGLQKNPFVYLSNADCFLFATNHESFGNVLLEALACGLPIISTDCKSGPREILAPNTDFKKQLKDDIEISEYGILTPINDKKNMIKAMKLIQTDKRLRDSYIQKAKNRASYFNKDTIIKEWITVIEN